MSSSELVVDPTITSATSNIIQQQQKQLHIQQLQQQTNRATTNCLTLGDGDFSYSLDLCRFLQAHSSSVSSTTTTNTKNSNNINDGDSLHLQKAYRIVCTGIDPVNELRTKYHDSDYILKSIRSINTTTNTNDDGKLKLSEQQQQQCSGSNNNNTRRKRPRQENSLNSTVPPSSSLKHHLSTNSSVTNSNRRLITISIHHGVNAIQPWNTSTNQKPTLSSSKPTTTTIDNKKPPKDDDNHIHNNKNNNNCQTNTKHKLLITPNPPLPSNLKYHTVLFNHPHLGTENALLHSQFLSHLFHSCVNHWLADGGVLHLSLVKGQCERWDCIERAVRSGLRLLWRGGFTVPPPPGIVHQHHQHQHTSSSSSSSSSNNESTRNDHSSSSSNTNRYKTRRHQSGKSFSSRTDGGSETLTFGRVVDEGLYGMVRHPWDQAPYNTANNKINKDTATRTGGTNNGTTNNALKCSYCDKIFKDERGRKNHIFCVHTNNNGLQDDTNNKHNINNKQQQPQTPLVCKLCISTDTDANTQPVRVFSNPQALQNHIRAKHSGLYTDIKPDWAAATITATGIFEKKIEDTAQGQLTNLISTTMTQTKQQQKQEEEQQAIIGSSSCCDVCQLLFASLEMKEAHFQDFIPTFLESSTSEQSKNQVPQQRQQQKTGASFACSQCGKNFKDQRAQRQHLNFCMIKPSVKPIL